MAIKIETKKTMTRGEKGRYINNIEALMQKDLPKKYLRGDLGEFRVYLDSYQNDRPNLWIFGADYNGPMRLFSGKTYPEKTFQKALSAIQKAGERLRQINREIKVIEAEWMVDPNETFVI